ncbi:VWA domain-containing protein [Hyphomonas sp.]|uniref:VWA domain-containing protein n=1 Tax=Hyphomonas sp. TaxID=87 RepID=UPI0035632CC6
MKSTLLTLAMTGLGLAMVLPAAAKPAPDPTPTAGSVHSYILLDRTGSMSDIWDEALGSVNAYAASVGEADEGEIEGADIKTAVTLAVFDYQESLQFDVLRKGVTSETWIDVTNDEANPRGMTPLFDAIGRVVSLAEADKPEKAVIVIMTDGYENSSKEITRDGAKAALDRAKANGWEVVFLGAEFASFGDADAVGMSASKTMAVGQGRMQESMSALAKKSRAYGKGEEAEIVFDESDRATAGEEDVKDRTGQ